MATLNPVLRRELKERMRTGRTGVVLTGYLAVLSIVLYALYTSAERQSGSFDPLATASLGRGMFESLLFVVLLLVCFLVPGYTAGAIVGERERQTLIPLQVTQMSASSIVVGKLLASLAFLFLLLIATAPLLAVSFFFGGVTLGEMLRGVAMVAVTGVLLASLSLAVSTVARRVQAATVMAYGLALVLTVGTLAFYGFEALVSTKPAPHNKAVLVLNPILATADAVAGQAAGSGTSSPLTSLRNLLDNNGGLSTGVAVAPFGLPSHVSSLGPVGPGHTLPYAAYSLGCFSLIIVGSLLIAVKKSTLPAASDRA